MENRIASLVAGLRERFPEQVSELIEAFGEQSIEVSRESLVEVARYLRVEGPFELLADWSCVDYLGFEPDERRFLIAAHLASTQHPDRLRVRVFVPAGDERCPSLVPVYAAARFQEREIFDFFGIDFEGHDNLRRIFMPDDWDGHPQRKDYPVGGVNVQYHGAFIQPPDLRRQGTTTTGYPGRTA